MLMFCFHIAFSVGLIALASSAAILIWAKVHENVGTGLAKSIGYLVVLFSVLNIACTSYCAFKYWQQGYFDKSYPMMSGQMMDAKNMPMMSGQMMKSQDGQNSMMQNQMNNAPTTQDAAAQHHTDAAPMPQDATAGMQNQMNAAPMSQDATATTPSPSSSTNMQ